MKLIDLKEEFEALNSLIEASEIKVDPETGEILNDDEFDEIIKDLTHELRGKKEDILNYFADKRREYKAIESALGDKIKNLQGKKKSAQNQQKRILNMIDFVLEGEKFKGIENTFFYVKRDVVEIISEEEIPPEYLDFKPTIKKKELTKALKSGAEIKGALIHEEIDVRIR